MGLNCYECIHKRNLFGDAHISCVFNWSKFVIEKLDKNTVLEFPSCNPSVRHWFFYPINYDPCWRDKCSGFKIQDEKYSHENPWSTLRDLSLIAKVFAELKNASSNPK